MLASYKADFTNFPLPTSHFSLLKPPVPLGPNRPLCLSDGRGTLGTLSLQYKVVCENKSKNARIK